MAARAPLPPQGPEAVALAVLALRNYVTSLAAPTQFEKNTAAQFKKLGLKKTPVEIPDICQGQRCPHPVTGQSLPV
jgi:hypothetical protein